MKRLNISKPELYILPMLLLLFFIVYHYYSFFVKGYTAINTFISHPFSYKQYEEIQKQHPYYEIYSLAEKYRDSDRSILFLMSKQDKNTLDFTSTIYAKKSKYLSEMGLMINYFFYPRFIPVYSPREFAKKKLQKDTIIISDIPLEVIKIPTSRYIPIPTVYKNYLIVNRWREDSYFIYEIIN